MKSLFLIAVIAAAQPSGSDQTGTIAGTVTDAVTHLPVPKAMVSLNFMGSAAAGQNQGPQSAFTDAGGAFTISGLQAGRYRLVFQHQNYPQARFGQVSKTVDVKAGEAGSPVNVELIPGAAITGRVMDEDGDPLMNCNIQFRSVQHPEQGPLMTGSSPSNEDGVYRAYGIAPGKYTVSAQCGQTVFQARALSSGPDPPPSKAYPRQYYPLTSEAKSAQAVELAAGLEKSGVDFQMVPTPVTQVHGVIAPGSADWRNTQVSLMLIGSDPMGQNAGSRVDPEKGTFEFPRVFPGSYTLFAVADGNGENRIGGWQRVDVGERPVEVALELRRGAEISGTVQIESNQNARPLTNSQIQITLQPGGSSYGAPPPPAQVHDDGSFTLKGIVPGMWRLSANAQQGFLKTAWLGSADVTNALTDLSAGGALRIVISTNTATIRGTAPPGENIILQETDGPFRGGRGIQVDQSGQYRFEGLAPGKYRMSVGPIPDEEGEEVTVHEGETAVVDLKAQH